MDLELKKAFSWEIDNFSRRTGLLRSDPFTSGGTEWHLQVNTKKFNDEDYLWSGMCVSNPKSFKLGWERRVKYFIVLLDQSGKFIYRTPGIIYLFCAKAPSWIVCTLPLQKIQEKGFIEKDKLTIEVYMKVLEVVHERNSSPNEMLYYNGFNIHFSQLVSVTSLFSEHPDCAVDVVPRNQEVKTAYMNLLIGLIQTLEKSPHSLFGTELSNAQSELSELMAAGFKIDWLKSKLDKIYLERKKALTDGSWVQQLEEHVSQLKKEVQQLEEHKSQLKKEVQQLEERVITLTEIKKEMTFSEFRKGSFRSWFSISKLKKVLRNTEE